MVAQLIDTSNELRVYRYRNGIKLVRPEHDKNTSFFSNGYFTGHTMGDILQLPFCTYFLDLNSSTQNINELTIEACGYNSFKHALGKTLFETFSSESAVKIISTDKKVIDSKKTQIVEDSALRKDDFSFHTLSIKSPWYENNNKIIGIFGCTIVLGKQPLDKSLEQIASLGLLDIKENHSVKFGQEVNDVYLSKREIECLHHTIQGKSAKIIGFELDISQRTVEEHIANIKAKLGVRTKTELIYKAINYLE